MKLIVFSDSHRNKEEAALITQMFANGLKIFHVNKPRYTEESYEEYIETIPEEYHNRLVIHQFHHLITSYNLRGIYLHRRRSMQKDYVHRLQMWWYRKRKPDMKVTCSFSKLSSMYEVQEDYDYVLLRPVFGSHSEGNYHSAFPETGLADALSKTKHNIVAFGGTNYDRLDAVFRLGFKGAAFKGGIWKADDPVKEFLRIKERTIELEKQYSSFQ